MKPMNIQKNIQRYKLLLSLFVMVSANINALIFTQPNGTVRATMTSQSSKLVVSANAGIIIQSPVSISGPLTLPNSGVVNQTASTASHIINYTGVPMVASQTLKLPVVATTASACTQSGLIVYSTSSNKLEVCNGTQFIKPY